MDEQEVPDWEEMASLSLVKYRLFAAERYDGQVKTLWNELVLDPEVDNEELTARFLVWCEDNAMLKLMFNTWIEGFTERYDGPVTYKEILQFINYLSMCEERHAMRILNGEI